MFSIYSAESYAIKLALLHILKMHYHSHILFSNSMSSLHPIILDIFIHYNNTHTHTTVLLLFGFCLGQPGWASEPVPEETFTQSHSSWSSIIPICFLHLLRSMASSLFNPHALQSFSTISLQVFFGLPLALVPSTSYSIHFFTQSLSSFRNTCPYHRNLFCCSTEIISSNPSLPVNSLLGTLSCNFIPHIHLTILISALWSATSFSFLTGLVSLPCNILLHTQLLYTTSFSL